MRTHRLALLLFLLALAICGTLALRAQDAGAVLKPPAGHQLALVVFEDLQCPDCAAANTLLHQAVHDYKIPLVVYDFPLPKHDWSFQAALIARYLDAKSPRLGDAFRTYIFEQQPQITAANLRTFADNFARAHNIRLPAAIDPDGKLAAEIRKDQDVGQRIGINHTPTIYVVTNNKSGTPFVEVVNRDQLYAMIDELKKTD